MKTRWYVLIGTVMIALVLAVANMAMADQIISDDIVAASPAWYNSASIFAPLGNDISVVDPSVVVRISIPVERGTPFSQGAYLRCYSDAGYTSGTPCDGGGGGSTYFDNASVTADGTMQSATFGFVGTIATGVYVSLEVYSDGGNVYGSCSAGTNLGGTNRSCSPTTDGVPYYTGIGTPPVPPVSDNTTRIISLTPSGEATTSPVALGMSYYVATSSAIDTGNLSLYRLESGNARVLWATMSLATGTISTWMASSSAVLEDGYYTARWSLTSSASILYNVSTSTTFIVGTSTWASLINLGSTTAAAAAATSTCAFYDVGCNVIAALTWAFSPSDESEQLLADSWEAFRAAPPLGYIGVYRDTLTLAFSTGTAPMISYPTSSLAIVDSIFGTSTMATGVQAVYWGGWAIVFYRATIALIAIAL